MRKVHKWINDNLSKENKEDVVLFTSKVASDIVFIEIPIWLEDGIHIKEQLKRECSGIKGVCWV